MSRWIFCFIEEQDDSKDDEDGPGDDDAILWSDPDKKSGNDGCSGEIIYVFGVDREENKIEDQSKKEDRVDMVL